MTVDQQTRLLNNIAEAMQGVPEEIVRRQAALFYACDPAYGAGVAARMGVNLAAPKSMQAAE